MSQFNGFEIKKYTSISELIESFYANRDFAYRIGQKTQDLRKLITQNIERCIRKKRYSDAKLSEVLKTEMN